MTRWSDDEVNPDTTYADAYDEGRDAFDNGTPADECPYSKERGTAQVGWLDGWETQKARREPQS
jgi:ribosome modulation factor